MEKINEWTFFSISSCLEMNESSAHFWVIERQVTLLKFKLLSLDQLIDWE